LNFKVEQALTPLKTLFRRAKPANTTIHPIPVLNSGNGQSGSDGGTTKPDAADANELLSTSWLAQDATTDDFKMKKQIMSVFSLTLIPALFTIYRAYYANGGPTWFSFHPMMMTTSSMCLMSAMLCQRLGGSGNVVRVGSLSFASMMSMILGVFAVYTTKEMYAKVHFLSMHSHFGGMAIFGLICYFLAAYYLYNPLNGTVRGSEKYLRYLMQWGKGAATLSIVSMMVGIIEIERTWTFLFVWMTSLLLFLPFLILPWHRVSNQPGKLNS
jgi:hypothetical protein